MIKHYSAIGDLWCRTDNAYAYPQPEALIDAADYDELYSLTNRLYRTLRLSSSCTCEYERAGVVPTWHPAEDGGPLERRLLRRCLRCTLLADYEMLCAAK